MKFKTIFHRRIQLQSLQGISKPTPFISFVDSRGIDVWVMTIPFIGLFILNSLDDLISLTAIPCVVLSFEQHSEYQRADKAYCNVCQDDTMSHRIPRLISGPVLFRK